MTRLAIGDWVLDPALNQASRGAEVQRLEPKMTEVLVALARRAGDVVSRETLLSEVWKNVTVSDDVLTQSITKLRQVLGDPSRESSYIQTIPKRGYRLIVPVKPYAGDAPPPDAIVKTRQRAPGRSVALWIAAALAVAAAVWGLGHAIVRPGPTIAELAQQVTGSGIDDLPDVVVQHFGEI
jgi:DNA-binding winged helix-turn-helix (wHTH) protein